MQATQTDEQRGVIEIVSSVLIKLRKKCSQSLSAACSTATASSLVEMSQIHNSFHNDSFQFIFVFVFDRRNISLFNVVSLSV